MVKVVIYRATVQRQDDVGYQLNKLNIICLVRYVNDSFFFCIALDASNTKCEVSEQTLTMSRITMCSVYSDIRDPAPRVDYTVGVISPDLRKKE